MPVRSSSVILSNNGVILMKYIKYIVMLIAFLLWWYNIKVNGVQNGSAYIQHVDGLVLVAGSGALVHWIPKLIQFENSLKHLHDKFDNHIRKKDEDK